MANGIVFVERLINELNALNSFPKECLANAL